MRYAAKKDLPLWFEDLHQTDLEEWRLTRTEAARILHVRHNRRTLSGMDAYLILWDQMPRYRFMTRVFGLPGLRQASGFVYDKIVSRCIFGCMRSDKPRSSRPRTALKP